MPTILDLTGKVAIVTGAGRGIGAAAAQALSNAGAAVALFDLDLASAQAVAKRLPGGTALQVDVTQEPSVGEAIAQVVAAYGHLDILVNNAGVSARVPAVELSTDDWQRVQDVNVKGVFLCARGAARQMQKQGSGGAIVNVASVMGFSGGLFPNASYQASKAAVVNLTRALALEWATDRIRVNAVAPTYVRTDLTAPLFENPAAMKIIMRAAPLGALPEPEDIGLAIVFLASAAARFITGHTLPVDSGYLAR